MENIRIKLKPVQANIILQMISEKNAVLKRESDLIGFIASGSDIDQSRIKGLEIVNDELVISIE
jgi:hypothetical protein